MRDKALISLNKKNALTAYEQGVKFFIKTVRVDYEVDRITAEKLAELLLSLGDTKFVKVQTMAGQAVLNVSNIMAVYVDESKARRMLSAEEVAECERQEHEQDEREAELQQRLHIRASSGEFESEAA